MKLRWVSSCVVVLVAVAAAQGQITVPNADDTDGAFSPVANVEVDLSLADTVSFADFQAGVNPNPGQGVYIPEQWAVVFRYSSVNIPSGVTVTFKNHPSRAPVVWLVSGSVTVTGTLSLNGSAGHVWNGVAAPASPGPGGFRGGRGQTLTVGESAAYGPGGAMLVSGNGHNPGGSYGTTGGGTSSPTYGNAGVLPLIGGSGGGPHAYPDVVSSTNGGGAGGGAILIAASNTITVTGVLSANGGPNAFGGQQGSSSGSGGGIRIVADTVSLTGYVQALGGAVTYTGYSGGNGRIRVEGNSIPNAITSPPASQASVGPVAQIWPSASTPSVRIVSVGAANAPADPWATLTYPPDVELSDPFPVTVVIEATNMPLDWTVNLRTVPIIGADINTPATFASGDATLSTWEAEVQLSNGFSVMQARAVAPNP